MPLNSSKALFVLDILRRETDVEHRLSAPALLKRLEEHGIRAERRSIYRAVDALRAHGERIEKTPTGYYYAREAPDKNDLYALTAAVQTAGFLSDARKQALFRALGALWGARAAEEIPAAQPLLRRLPGMMLRSWLCSLQARLLRQENSSHFRHPCRNPEDAPACA